MKTISLFRLGVIWMLFLLPTLLFGQTPPSSAIQEEQISRWIVQNDTPLQVVQETYKNYINNTPNPSSRLNKRYGRWFNFWNTRTDSNDMTNSASRYLLDYIESNSNEEICRSGGQWENEGVYLPQQQNQGIGVCLHLSPEDSTRMYIGSNTGGLWKTNNDGDDWFCVTDNPRLPCMGVQAIAGYYNATTNEDVLYIGTGFASNSIGAHYGVGLLKSTDSGETWDTTGFSWTASYGDVIRMIKIAPNDPNTIYVGSKKGLFVSYDGGISKDTLLFGLPSGHDIRDLEFVPSSTDGKKFFVSTGRTTQGNNNSAVVFYTDDGGLTFSNATPPNTNNVVAYEMATCAADPDYVYIYYRNSITSPDTTLYPYQKSNGGAWTTISNLGFNSDIKINPSMQRLIINQYDPNIFYTGNIRVIKFDLNVSNEPINIHSISGYFNTNIG